MKLMALLSLSLIPFLMSSFAFSAPTMDQCAREYKRCKNDMANMFDKKSCKKARARCEGEAQLAQQQGSMKNKMLNGTAGATDTTTVTPADRADGNLMVKPVMSPREAAEQRMREREQSQQGAAVGVGSIRGQLGGSGSASAPAPGMNNFEKSPEQKKAEARQRLMERERAKAGEAQTIDNFKSN